VKISTHGLSGLFALIKDGSNNHTGKLSTAG